MTNYFNIRETKSPLEYFKEDKENGSYETIKQCIRAYTNKNREFFTDDVLFKLPAFNFFSILLNKTFTLTVEKLDEDSRPQEGFLCINHENSTLCLQARETHKLHPITIDDKLIKIKDIRKPILSLVDGEENSDFSESFMENYTKMLLRVCVTQFFSRYKIVNKPLFYKEIKKIQWTRNSDLRWAIKEIEKTIGVKESEYTLQDGRKFIGLAPVKRLIHDSFDVIVAEQNWDSFSDEKNLFIQGGSSGIVFSEKGNYKTAFIEVFPNKLKDGEKTFSSFIRGEGPSIKEAEEKAYAKMKKAVECKDHKWNPRERTDGCGYCDNCGVFNSKAFK